MIEITPDKVDWAAVGKRILGYRLVNGWDREDLAHRCGIPASWINRIENGQHSKSLEELWTFVKSEKISVNWIINGVNEYFSEDPPDTLPETIIHFRGAGIRRTKERQSAEEGQIVGDPLDFVLAVESYKRLNKKPFPSLTEMFEILLELGYRKVAAPTINPRKCILPKKEHNK